MSPQPGAGGSAVAVGHAAARPQQPRHRIDRDVTVVRLAEGPKHLDPAGGRGRRGLAGRPGLADARRSPHIHDTTAATDGAVPNGVEARPLPAPPRRPPPARPAPPPPRRSPTRPAPAPRLPPPP